MITQLASTRPLPEYDNDPSVVYAVDGEFRITYHNAAWDQFAINNGGPAIAGGSQIGRSILEVTSEPLRPFYATAFQSVLSDNLPWEHVYECSSADTQRTLHMQALRLDPNTLVIVNSRVSESAAPGLISPDDFEYVGNAGFVVMCCHCRRTKRQNSAEPAWDWIREFIEKIPQRCSHGLCPTCFAYHYKEFLQPS